jgi:amino acid transporter
MSLISLLLGRRLASDEQASEKIGVFSGLPAFGLDGLSSAAYGPEAALAVLVPLGAASLSYIGPITAVILALLTILYFSYRQTIAAYPVNGGSYTVAKENLGVWPSLLAAAALMIDYVLNVAVGISAGIAALVSAFPNLQPYTVGLCLAVLALVTFVNLRGTGEAGVAFALPTYLFIGTMVAVLVIGIVRALLAHGHPVPSYPPAALPKAEMTVGLWLLLRSFASGCTAMTGVEAVSNGVSAFKEPRVQNAHRTLTIIVSLLAVLLAGIAYLASAYKLGAMDQNDPGYQSILSQLTGAVVGRGWFYYLTMAGILAVLCLSANTSFVDFPRLCYLIAKDDFLPGYFAAIGRRLVFSTGVLFLTAAAALLLIGFKGITDDLIPLYAVGAFTAFTLSQAGMVVHWRKRLKDPSLREAGDLTSAIRLRQWVNGVGAAATGTALAIIIAAKFLEGAWITILAIPIMLTIFKLVHRHYKLVEGMVLCEHCLDLSDNPLPVVLIPMRGWTQSVHKALRLAVHISSDVVAAHLSNLEGDAADDEAEAMRKIWAERVEAPARTANVPPPKLVIVQTPYREFTQPLLAQIDQIKAEHAHRLVAVIIPELIERHWLQSLLHLHRTWWLRRALLSRGDFRVVVIDLPWFVEFSHPQNGQITPGITP